MRREIKHVCFPVEKVLSIELMPTMEFNSENSYAIVAKWPDIPTRIEGGKFGDIRKKVLNFCSDIYKLIENSSILEPLIPVLEKKFSNLIISASNYRDGQFIVRMTPVVPTFAPKSEVIKPAIFFMNSYDGKVLAQAIGGLVRYVVDEKGNVETTYSTYLTGLSFAYTFKHSNEEIYSMEGISAQVDSYIENFVNVENQIDLLKQITISNPTPKKLEKMIRNLTTKTNFPLKEIEETIDRVLYEAEVFQSEISLWMIYNSINYVVSTSEASLSDKQRIDTDSRVYANLLEFIPKESEAKPTKKKKKQKVS